MDNLRTSKQLDIDDTVLVIEQAEIKEREAIIAYRSETDPDFKLSHKEDAYLQSLIQVREGKLMGKKYYDSEGVEACTGMKYEDLNICDWEDFVIDSDES